MADNERLRLSDRERELIAALPRTSFVARQLDAGGTTWSSFPSGLPAEIFFQYRSGKGSRNGFKTSRYAGISLFGGDNVVGVSLANDDETLRTRLSALLANEELAYLMNETKAQVEFLTTDKLAEWLKFYQHLDEIDPESGLKWIDRLGARAGEVSGIEVLGPEGSYQTANDLEKLIEANLEKFGKMGVNVAKDYYGLDYGFLSKKTKELMGIKLCHVRVGQEDGGFLVEKVYDEMERVVGLSLRKPGQTKREHYAEVAALESKMNDEWGTKRKPYRIIAVSGGSVKLWRKIGMLEHPHGDFPKNPEIEKTILRAFRLLYWGRDTLHPGPLASLGYSMPGYGNNMNFQNLDGVFLRRDVYGKAQYAVIDNLMGIKKGRKVSLSNVAGFIAFPNEMKFEDRQAWSKPAEIDFNKRTGIARRNIWHIDDLLLDEIERSGTPFFQGRETDVEGLQLMPEFPARKALKYYQEIKETQRELWMRWFRLKPMVGGDRQILELETDKTVFGLWFDYGYTFDPDPAKLRVMKQLGRVPPTNDGLRRLLNYGDLVMSPGIHEIWYLQKTARHWPGLASDEMIKRDPVARYVVAELYSRMKKDEIKAEFTAPIAESIIRNGPAMVVECFGNKEHVVYGMTPTHFHYDHMGAVPYVDKSIPQLWSGTMYALGLGATIKGASWRSRYTYSVNINEERAGSQAYPTQEKDIQVYWKSGITQRLSPFTRQTSWIVDHSVPASWKVTEVDMGNDTTYKLFNSGDWRWGHYTEKALNDILNKKIVVDGIIQEGTRLTREESPAVVKINEETVKESFGKYLDDTHGTTRLVSVTLRSSERLFNLVNVALEKGLKVALTDSHAIDALQYASIKEIAPMDAEAFDWVLPYSLGEDKVTIWAREMTTPRRHVWAVREIAGAGKLGLLTPERLSDPKEAGKWVIFVTPFDILEDQFGATDLSHGVSMFWSAPSVYEDQSKAFWDVNKSWLTGAPFHGGWFADFDVIGRQVVSVKNPYGKSHSSGHASGKHIVEVIDNLVGRDRKNVPLYLVHTDHPEQATNFLTGKLGNKIKVVSVFPKYDPKDPFVKSGARFRLA